MLMFNMMVMGVHGSVHVPLGVSDNPIPPASVPTIALCNYDKATTRLRHGDDVQVRGTVQVSYEPNDQECIHYYVWSYNRYCTPVGMHCTQKGYTMFGTGYMKISRTVTVHFQK
jgi:hypothetical protein